MPKKQIKEQEIEKEELDDEESNIEKVADLTIENDNLKDKIKDLEEELSSMKNKYEDEHKANKRLMQRITDKEDVEYEKNKRKENLPSKLSELYDFKNGRIDLNKFNK